MVILGFLLVESRWLCHRPFKKCYLAPINLAMSQKTRFSIRISSEQYLAYYQRAVNNVSVVASDGRRIQFPAKLLQKFVTHDGIDGLFEMEFDDQHKLIELRKL